MKRIKVVLTYVKEDHYDGKINFYEKQLEFRSRASKEDVSLQISRLIDFVSRSNKWIVMSSRIGGVQENISGQPLQEDFRIRPPKEPRLSDLVSTRTKAKAAVGIVLAIGLGITALLNWLEIMIFIERINHKVSAIQGQIASLPAYFGPAAVVVFCVLFLVVMLTIRRILS